MKKTVAVMGVAALTTSVFAANTLSSNPNYKKLKNFHPNVSNDTCLMCHKTTDPGIVADWKHSKHAKAGVGCVECHVVPKDYPTAFKAHPFKGPNWTVQIAVSSVTWAKCHAKDVKEYLYTGHAWGAAQWLATNANPHGYKMSKLSYHYESLKGANATYGVSGSKMAKGIWNDLQV